MNNLIHQHCQACEGGVAPFNESQVQEYLTQLDEWEVNAEGTEIFKIFNFNR